MAIVKREMADSIVFDFVPKKFPIVASTPANKFIHKQDGGKSDFVINPLVAEQTGIAEVNRQKIATRVEEMALDQLQEVQEKAYKEAYQLGLEEGRELAFKEYSEELVSRLQNLDDIIAGLDNVKKELVDQNEAQILKLLHLLASRMAMREVELDKTIIIDVMGQVLDEGQNSENVVIRVSKEDHKFLELLRKKKDKKLDFLKNIRLEPSESTLSGGCVMESDFGSIDATLEQRVDKAWQSIQSRLPKIHSTSTTNAEDSDEFDSDEN